MRTLVVTKSAEADLLDGYRDYESKQAGLGARFLDEVEQAFNRILPNPMLYQEVEPEIRRCIPHVFPYLIFYAFDSDSVSILAVIHGAQAPASIQKRLLH
jgi:toxin ParE1/3/4